MAINSPGNSVIFSRLSESLTCVSLPLAPRIQRPVKSDLGHSCPFHTSRQLVTPCYEVVISVSGHTESPVTPSLSTAMSPVTLTVRHFITFVSYMLHYPFIHYSKMFPTFLVFYGPCQLDYIF